MLLAGGLESLGLTCVKACVVLGEIGGQRGGCECVGHIVGGRRCGLMLVDTSFKRGEGKKAGILPLGSLGFLGFQRNFIFMPTS